MVNIYDDANNLVANLKKHDYTIRFKEIRKKIMEEDKELFEKIQEFQNLNVEINTELLLNGEVSEEKKEKSKKLYEELVGNEKASEYFQAELNLNKMVEDINVTIMDGIRDIFAQ